MKRAWCFSMVVAVAASVLLGSLPSAEAFPNFKIQFDKRYMTEGSALHKVLEGKTNCNVCHVGADKKKKNDYGVALDKLLSRDDMQNVEKIQQALEKVETEKCSSGTFGDLIKEGKLPITK
jgi:hypothetical protein